VRCEQATIVGSLSATPGDGGPSDQVLSTVDTGDRHLLTIIQLDARHGPSYAVKNFNVIID